jgi:hypothetical protein
MVLVFLLVLSATMLVASSLGWTDMRVVTTVRDERAAARIAEAGVAEGLKRLSMTAPSSVSVDGDTFNPAFAAATGHSDCTQSTDYCPDETNPNWAATIQLGSGGTSKSGNLVTTRTIQTNSDRVIYGNTTMLGSTSPDPDQGDLTIRWNCTSPLLGWPCTDASSIRKLFNMPVIDIISTGYYPSRSHPNAASRKMTVSVIPGVPGFGAYKTACPPNGVAMVGTVQVTVQGTVQIDSPCNGGANGYAIDGNGGTLVQTGGQMNVVGDVSAGHATSPDLNTGAPSQPDPLGPSRANLVQPCFGSVASNCYNITADYGAPTVQDPCGSGTSAAHPITCSVNGGTLNPGIYYGGLRVKNTVTFNSGIYIIAGGGLQLQSGSTTLLGSHVMFFNTQDDDATGRANYSSAGNIDTFNTQGNVNVNWTSPSSGYYQGIAIFQARVSDGVSTQPQMSLQGGNGNNGLIDGLIYAVDANLNFQGGVNVAGNVIVGSMTANGSVDIGGTATSSPLIAQKAGFTQIVAWKDY